MSTTTLMWPVFVQVLLTLVVLIWMGRARLRSLQQTRTSPEKREVALGQYAWSDAAKQASNNFKNQFETPVLFFAGVAFALILKQTDLVLVALAWGYVVTRLAHALIHLGSNVVRLRFLAYVVGALCLLAFWVVLMVRVLNGSVVV